MVVMRFNTSRIFSGLAGKKKSSEKAGVGFGNGVQNRSSKRQGRARA
jgi:hypothetical protein